MPAETTRTIKVDYLARVEGEGALTIKLEGDRATKVELRLFEPPRFFEAFLRGRSQTEAPDITARICGICPVAYQRSACHAIESGLGITVDGPLRTLRRLLYCGEWLESHVLHMFLLHAPDFLGYDDALATAKDHPEIVKRALRMKKAGNAVVAMLGGREIHPINVRIGGFYRVPARSELHQLTEELKWGRDAAMESVAWMAGFDFPDFERDYEFVALRHPDEYPLTEGRLVSNKGLDIAVQDYDDHFTEEHVARSTALHSTRKEGGEYQCGPLARVNLNFDRLSAGARQVATSIGFTVPCMNPFKSLLARALETIHAFEQAVEILNGYEPPARPKVDVPTKAATGFGCTEAPRGIFFHRYRLDAEGIIQDAKIVPPTAQNQKSMESDLRQLASRLAKLSLDQAALLAEHAVRNSAPCISCSTHFLRLNIEREDEA